MTKQELQDRLLVAESVIGSIKEMFTELKAGDPAKWSDMLPWCEGAIRYYDKRCAGENGTESEAA